MAQRIGMEGAIVSVIAPAAYWRSIRRALKSVPYARVASLEAYASAFIRTRRSPHLIARRSAQLLVHPFSVDLHQGSEEYRDKCLSDYLEGAGFAPQEFDALVEIAAFDDHGRPIFEPDLASEIRALQRRFSNGWAGASANDKYGERGRASWTRDS